VRLRVLIEDVTAEASRLRPGCQLFIRQPAPRGVCKTALTEIRLETLKRYGNDEVLKPRFPDATERAAAIAGMPPTGPSNGTPTR